MRYEKGGREGGLEGRWKGNRGGGKGVVASVSVCKQIG